MRNSLGVARKFKFTQITVLNVDIKKKKTILISKWCNAHIVDIDNKVTLSSKRLFFVCTYKEIQID